jgi:hypothetical protein
MDKVQKPSNSEPLHQLNSKYKTYGRIRPPHYASSLCTSRNKHVKTFKCAFDFLIFRFMRWSNHISVQTINCRGRGLQIKLNYYVQREANCTESVWTIKTHPYMTHWALARLQSKWRKGEISALPLPDRWSYFPAPWLQAHRKCDILGRGGCRCLATSKVCHLPQLSDHHSMTKILLPTSAVAKLKTRNDFRSPATLESWL